MLPSAAAAAASGRSAPPKAHTQAQTKCASRTRLSRAAGLLGASDEEEAEEEEEDEACCCCSAAATAAAAAPSPDGDDSASGPSQRASAPESRRVSVVTWLTAWRGMTVL